jgi:tetratricopeptide (TPR) repeat protein
VLGDQRGALADYTQAITLNPHDAAAYYSRGNIRFNLKAYKAARADYTQAITLEPQHAAAYYNRGNARFNLKAYKAARADYQKAADLYQQQGKIADYQDTVNQMNKLPR